MIGVGTGIGLLRLAGELLELPLSTGAARIVVGLTGSAVHDAGAGLLERIVDPAHIGHANVVFLTGEGSRKVEGLRR